MRVGHRFVLWNHTRQQLTQYTVRFEFIQQLVVSLNAAVQLGDQDATHPQAWMPPALTDVVDLVDHAQ